jgi:hypothetical protein
MGGEELVWLPASPGEITLAGSRRLRSILAAAPVLFAHAVVAVAKTARNFTPWLYCSYAIARNALSFVHNLYVLILPCRASV